MRPHGLNTFTVCQSDAIHQHKVVWTLAAGAMAYEVELGYRNKEGDFVEIDIERQEVS